MNKMNSKEKKKEKYSWTSRYGHLSYTDTLSITDSFQSPDKVLIYFLKQNFYNTDSLLIRTTDTRPQRVNSYYTWPLYYRHCSDQANPESRSGESAEGESHLVWLMSYARWYKAQSVYTKQRFAKGVQRNITNFLKA